MTIAMTPALAPDPALPQRDVLLDGEAMRARLEALLHVQITAYEQARVKYRIGQSLRVVHRLEIDGRSVLVSSRTFLAGRSAPAFERARGAGVAHDAALETVFWTFPGDRKLARLGALAAGPGLLSRLLGREVAETVLAAYAPEKSATAACLGAAGGAPIAYAKVFADAGSAAWSARVHAQVAELVGTEHPLLRTPVVLAHSADDHLVMLEALGGRCIDTLDGARSLAAMRGYGAALAALHALAPIDGAPPFTRVTAQRRRTAAALIARARPDVAAQIDQLLDDLDAAVPGSGEQLVCLHGDVHAKNAIAQDDGRIALIDLDQAAAGPASAELGSMLAGLRYHALVGGEPFEPAQHAFLAGYASAGSLPDPAALRWSVAAALVCERALRCVNRVRNDGLARLGAVLADAQDTLDGSTP